MVCLTVDESVVARAPARSHFGSRLQLAARVRMMHAVIEACRLNIAGCDIVIQIHAAGGAERQAEVVAAVKVTVPDLAVLVVDALQTATRGAVESSGWALVQPQVEPVATKAGASLAWLAATERSGGPPPPPPFSQDGSRDSRWAGVQERCQCCHAVGKRGQAAPAECEADGDRADGDLHTGHLLGMLCAVGNAPTTSP